MNKKFFVFAFIFFIFFSLGIFLFVKSLKEIKKIEEETSFKVPEIESKSEGEFKIESKTEGEFKLKDFNGKEYTLKNFNGKVVFLTFWATWCRSCAMELPTIQKLYDELKGEEIEFILVSQEKKEKISDYLKKYGYNFPAYIQVGNLPVEFRTEGIPTNFIIDKNGKIVDKKVGYYDWSNKEAKEFLKSLL